MPRWGEAVPLAWTAARQRSIKIIVRNRDHRIGAGSETTGTRVALIARLVGPLRARLGGPLTGAHAELGGRWPTGADDARPTSASCQRAGHGGEQGCDRNARR